MGIYRQDLHGQLNHQIELLKYKGIPSETAITIVDNDKRTIKVDCDAAFAEKYAKLDDFLVEIDARTVGDRDLNDRLDTEEAERKHEDFSLGVSIAKVNTELNARVDQEIADREEAISEVTVDISEEAEARAVADNDLSDRITAEAQTRAAADTDLSERLTSEIQERTVSDNDLSTRINTEKESREYQDEQLLNRIIAEEESRASGDQDLSERLANETSQRVEKDDDLSAQISNEKQDRETGDAALLERLQQEETTRQQQVANLDSRLNAEKQTRAAADTDLSNQIASEKTTREQRDNEILVMVADETESRIDEDSRLDGLVQTLQNDLSSETEQRVLADEALDSKIETEIQDRSDAINGLNVRVDQEAEERSAQDLSLQEQIAQEVSDRELADNSLNDRITEEVTERIGKDAEIDGRLSIIDDSLQDNGQRINALEIKEENFDISNTDGYVDISESMGEGRAKQFSVNISQSLLDIISNKWNYTICTDASNTPDGVTWGQITGTLVASEETMYTFYLVPARRESGSDVFEEYVTVLTTDSNDQYRWEKFGVTDIDLTDYAKKEWVEAQNYLVNGSGTVSTGNLANRSVTADKISFGAVESDSIIDGAITMGKIADSAVLTQHLSNDSVITAKIANGAVTPEKLSQLYLTQTDPSGTGSLSLNRKVGTVVGTRSVAVGEGTEASSTDAFAEGKNTVASGLYSHSEGVNTVASGDYGSHAEGNGATALGQDSHAEGYQTSVQKNHGHAEGYKTIVSGGVGAHAEGDSTQAKGDSSHAEGVATIASIAGQHAQGKYSVEDTEGRYADIVGWGSSMSTRKNISALETNGTLRLKGDAYVNCSDDSTGGLKLASENWVNSQGFLKSSDLSNYVSRDVIDGIEPTNIRIIGNSAEELTNSSHKGNTTLTLGIANPDPTLTEPKIKIVAEEGIEMVNAVRVEGQAFTFNGDKVLTGNSLQGYATEQWVENQDYVRSVQLDSYATRDWVQMQQYITLDFAQRTYFTKQEVIDLINAALGYSNS